jgi:hypothetical protein
MNEAENKKVRRMANDEMPDPEKIKEIIQVMSESIPSLLSSIAQVLYGEKEGGEYGKAVANFYKSVKAGGMSDEQAFILTKEYMGNFNIAKAMGGMMAQGRGKRED